MAKRVDAFDMARKMSADADLDVEEVAVEKNNEQLLDELMDTPGFAEFLAKHPEAEELSEAENLNRVSKLHEAFGKAQETNKEMNTFFKDQAKGLGLELTDDELKFVGEHIENMAINNPEEMAGLMDTIKIYRGMPAALEAQRAEVAKFDNKTPEEWKELVKERDVLKYYDSMGQPARGKIMGVVGSIGRFANYLDRDYPEASGGFLAKAGANRQLWNDIRKDYGLEAEQIKDRIVEIQTAIDQANNAIALEAEMAEVFQKSKDKLVSENILPLEQLRKLIQNKMAEKAFAAPVNDPEEAFKNIEELQKNFEAMSGGDFDFTRDFDSDVFQKGIDTFAEAQVDKEIDKALVGAKTDKLTNFEEGFKRYLDGLEGLGSKDQEETKRFVVDKMKAKMAELCKDSDPKSKAKAILLRRVIAKIQANKI